MRSWVSGEWGRYIKVRGKRTLVDWRGVEESGESVVRSNDTIIVLRSVRERCRLTVGCISGGVFFGGLQVSILFN